MAAVLQALVPALFMNICIVGLNQIYDVPIDKINKPYLPLASGEFSMQTGVALVRSWSTPSHLHDRACPQHLANIKGPCVAESLLQQGDRGDEPSLWVLVQVAASGIIALGLGFLAGSPPLLATLAGSLVLGIAYSTDVPFLRWKQNPVAAAGCILAVRRAPPAGGLKRRCLCRAAWHAPGRHTTPAVKKHAVIHKRVMGDAGLAKHADCALPAAASALNTSVALPGMHPAAMQHPSQSIMAVRRQCAVEHARNTLTATCWVPQGRHGAAGLLLPHEAGAGRAQPCADAAPPVCDGLHARLLRHHRAVQGHPGRQGRRGRRACARSACAWASGMSSGRASPSSRLPTRAPSAWGSCPRCAGVQPVVSQYFKEDTLIVLIPVD